MQFHLFEDELTHGPLDPHRQKLVGVKLLVGPLSSCRSQEWVVTREQNLKKVMVIEPAITVEVKVIDHEYEVFWRYLSVPVLPFELAKFFGADETRCVSIKSFESSVRLKISYSCQYLAHFLYCKLLICYEKQKLLQFKF